MCACGCSQTGVEPVVLLPAPPAPPAATAGGCAAGVWTTSGTRSLVASCIGVDGAGVSGTVAAPNSGGGGSTASWGLDASPPSPWSLVCSSTLGALDAGLGSSCGAGDCTAAASASVPGAASLAGASEACLSSPPAAGLVSGAAGGLSGEVEVLADSSASARFCRAARIACASPAVASTDTKSRRRRRSAAAPGTTPSGALGGAAAVSVADVASPSAMAQYQPATAATPPLGLVLRRYSVAITKLSCGAKRAAASARKNSPPRCAKSNRVTAAASSLRS